MNVFLFPSCFIPYALICHAKFSAVISFSHLLTSKQLHVRLISSVSQTWFKSGLNWAESSISCATGLAECGMAILGCWSIIQQWDQMSFKLQMGRGFYLLNPHFATVGESVFYFEELFKNWGVSFSRCRMSMNDQGIPQQCMWRDNFHSKKDKWRMPELDSNHHVEHTWKTQVFCGIIPNRKLRFFTPERNIHLREMKPLIEAFYWIDSTLGH